MCLHARNAPLTCWPTVEWERIEWDGRNGSGKLQGGMGKLRLQAWDGKGCRNGNGLRNATGCLGFSTKSSPHDSLLNTQNQKLKTCPAAFLVQSKGSISSAMGSPSGSPGELGAHLGAQRAKAKAAELDPGVGGPELPQSAAAEGPRPGSRELPASDRAHTCPCGLSAWLGNPAQRVKLEPIKH